MTNGAKPIFAGGPTHGSAGDFGRAVITGGFGFVGRAVCANLTRQGCEVLVVDNCVRANLTNLEPDVRNAVQHHVGDIRDESLLGAALTDFRPDLIIHLAALHYIPDCEADPQECLAINVGGTRAVLSAVSRYRARDEIGAVVLASTAAVYAPSLRPHAESEAPGPIDVYGRSKLEAEHAAAEFHQSCGLPIGVARLFNVVGPGETNPHLLPTLVSQALRSNVLRVGDLSTVRDYVHADDVARGISSLAQACRRDQVTINNFGTGHGVDGWGVLNTIATVLGRELRVEQDSSRLRTSDRPCLVSDQRRTSSALGWVPVNDLCATVSSLVQVAPWGPFHAFGS